jgi:23S rRNA (cytidine2498-2'-O)-methyltransferase
MGHCEERIHACRPGFEGALAQELSQVFPHSQHAVMAPGWTRSNMASKDLMGVPAVAFATQTLPQTQEMCAPSIRAWADLLVTRLNSEASLRENPWRLHVFGQDYRGSPVRRQRWQRIEDAVTTALEQHHRALAQSRNVMDGHRWQPNERLVQLALVKDALGYWSCCGALERLALRRCISGWPGGVSCAPEDPWPPSRAYLKLLDAEMQWGACVGMGQTCVDLGASPGGWTAIALQRGARVVAVDRSPLRADLMRREGLTFVRGDAFKYVPRDRVDWLLCDVIALPERTLQLLTGWLTGGWCRQFLVSVKFRGSEGYGCLHQFKDLLAVHAREFVIRQLMHNGNEVTCIGEAQSAESAA